MALNYEQEHHFCIKDWLLFQASDFLYQSHLCPKPELASQAVLQHIVRELGPEVSAGPILRDSLCHHLLYQTCWKCNQEVVIYIDLVNIGLQANNAVK